MAGVRVGHHQRRGRGWLTGTTVVLTPPNTSAGCDVRGGGPGTRETDLLDPCNMVEHVDAICLTGGSAYGLAAADGVMRALEAQGRGFEVGEAPHQVVPIVPAAVLFDLGAGGSFAHRPDATFGERATLAARDRPIAQGCVGAGTGAHIGALLKGGVGSASVVLANGITVAALVVVNSSGLTFDPSTGELWGRRHGLPGEFDAIGRPDDGELAAFAAALDVAEAARQGRSSGDLPTDRTNTTLVVVATDARLEVAECTRLAGSAHDGMARAINPIHLYHDGDVAFALSTGAIELPSDRRDGVIRPASTRPAQLGPLLAAAADVTARAVVHATLAATTVRAPGALSGRLTSYVDQFPSAISSTH
ncbi:MAG: P1 family peptidase [Nocardiopsis sp. BM-2018]|nr:MAG: P1 family peptidase [Nocardiopsis sp. BM-2018]